MSRPARALAMFLGSAGVTHFANPRFYDPLVPESLPGTTRAWTYGSGAVELAVATVVAVPRTRRVGGLLAAVLFVAVLPGNIKMAVDFHREHKSALMRAGSLLRLPLQIPLVLWALRVRRNATP